MMLIASSPVWVGISSLLLHLCAHIYSVYIQSTIYDRATPKSTHFFISVLFMWKVTKMGLRDYVANSFL